MVQRKQFIQKNSAAHTEAQVNEGGRNMKDIYETPVMEVIYFEAEDIITNMVIPGLKREKDSNRELFPE